MKTSISRRSRVPLAALIVAAIVASCDDSPPTTPVGPSQPPPSRVATGVRIEGPSSIAPGASVQYRLVASFDDGTTSDVAAQATWTTGNASVLTASPGGIVRGASRGESALSARYLTQTTHIYVLVLEDGTYRLSGRVTESGGGLPGARIDVVAGRGAGLSATTEFSGSYALYGVAGEVRIEATLDGFEKARRTIVVSEHSTADLVLRPAVAPANLNGDWRLTLSASSACTPPVPEDAATRSYAATVSQIGTFVRVELRSPELTTPEARVEGIVIDRRLTFRLPFDDFYYAAYGLRYYTLIEALGPTRFLAIAGTAHGERLGSAVTGTLDGEFALYLGGGGSGVRNRQFSCWRSDHAFRLDRN